MSELIIQVRDLSKSYLEGETHLQVLSNLSLDVSRGERLAIVGLSGSGKSTLLHLLGGLDDADSGEILVAGESVRDLKEKQQCELRNKTLGFVYQFHHLLSEFDAQENVAMPLLIRGVKKSDALDRASDFLNRVGLSKRAKHRPAQLSGGERQRVAIARALVGDPLCVLADEPTGNLDETSAASVDELMVELSGELGTSFVVVTHNSQLAAKMDRTLTLHNGQLVP